jgi:hypothetical protein
MHTLRKQTFLAVVSTFLLAAHLPAAEPKPFVAELKPDILKFEPFTWPDATKTRFAPRTGSSTASSTTSSFTTSAPT